MRWLMTVCLFAASGCILPAFGAAPPAKVPAEWLKLIEELGDEDTRKQAATKLAALGEDVLPALRHAKKTHGDVDVRLAATVLAAGIEKGLYREVLRFEGNNLTTRSIAAAPGGRRIVTGYFADPVARVWDVKTGKEVLRLEGHQRGVYGIDWSADGERIASAGGDGVLMLWDARTGKAVKKIEVSKEPLYAVAITPDGKKAVTCGYSGDKVRVWDLATGNQLVGNRDAKQVVYSLAMLPDGKQVVVSGLGGEVWLLDVETGKRVRPMSGGVAKYGYCVAASPCGRLVAAGGDEKVVRLWDVKTGKWLGDLEGHTRYCHKIAFSRDGKRLISASDDRSCIVWGVQSGKILDKFQHDSNAIGAILLPDDRHAITSSYDKTLRLWRIRKEAP